MTHLTSISARARFDGPGVLDGGAGRSGRGLGSSRDNGLEADDDPDQVERYRRPSGSNPAAVGKQSPANHVDGMKLADLPPSLPLETST
jgi:hypothetical protein